MKPLLVVLQKLIVYPFYRDNISFFFFWLMLLVGLQNPGSRLFTEPFLSSVVQTPVILTVVLALLALYFIKCNQYVTKTLAEPENEFLYVLGLFPKKITRLSWLAVFASIYLPALFYLGLLTWSAARLELIVLVLLLLSYSLVLAFIFMRQFTRRHQRVSVEINYTTWFTFRWLPAPFQYLTVFIKYLMQQEKSLLVLAKLFSCVVTWAFLRMYPVAEYGIRPAAIGFLMGLVGHNVLVFRTRWFEEERLWLLRQLPLQNGQRFALLLITYGFALLPEYIFLLLQANRQFTFLSILPFYLFGTTFLLLLHCLLYRADTRQEHYFRQIFYLFFGVLLLILFSVPLLVLTAFCSGISFFLLVRYYYRFETHLQE